MNTLVKIGLFAVGGYALYKVFNLAYNVNMFAQQLGFAIKAGEKPISLTGSLLNPVLRLNLDCEFTNPTKVAVEVKRPRITILYKGKILVQSPIPSDNDIIRIDPMGVSIAKNFSFTLPLTDANVISSLIDMGKVLGTGIAARDEDGIIAKIQAVTSTLSNNLDSLLPLFDINCLVYTSIGDFTYNTKIV